MYGIFIHVHVGVEVHAKSTQTGCSSIFRADAAIMSVPLGVLKANTISFHPPLPEWKTQAISNLGFGLLNKVGYIISLIHTPSLHVCARARVCVCVCVCVCVQVTSSPLLQHT